MNGCTVDRAVWPRRVVFLAKEGHDHGKVISSGVLGASDWALRGLVP